MRRSAATRLWDGNSTADDMIAFAWQGSDGARSLVVVNYAPQPGQCYVRLPFPDLGGQPIRLEGRLGTTGYERDGDSLLAAGLYVDLPPVDESSELYDVERVYNIVKAFRVGWEILLKDMKRELSEHTPVKKEDGGGHHDRRK